MMQGGADAPVPTGTLAGSAGGPSPAGPLLPGDPRRLGPYRVLGRLGEGGMGTVFLAQDAGSASAAGGAQVAVKVIRAEFARDEQFRARFRREAEAARRVAPFCTAQVLDVVLDGEVAYLVTEFIDGPTLAAWIAQDGPLRGSMLDSLATGVAAALNGIHAAGIVHRDLKAGNVLLSRLGPKVIDFGIARVTDHAGTRTDSGPVIGTPAYMAPEQFDGKITAASDVFAWGCVITYAGTGRTPFGAGTPYEVMRRVTTAEPDLSGLAPRLRDLVGRALSKRPEQRPTARELLLALVGDTADPVLATTRMLNAADWTRPEPETEPAPTRVEQPRRIPRRPLVLAGVAVAAVVATAAAAPVLLPGRGTPEGNSARRGSGSGTAPSSEKTAGAGTAPSNGTTGPDTAPSYGTAGPSTPAGDAGTPPARASSAGADPADTLGQRIAVGARVPATGTATLGVGEVHSYRVQSRGEQVYLQNVAEDCAAHLLPWKLTRSDGSTVAETDLTCDRYGPVRLPAGEYELRIGRTGVEGSYVLQLIRA